MKNCLLSPTSAEIFLSDFVVALTFVALGSSDFFYLCSFTSLFQLSQREDLKPSHVRSSNLTHLQGKCLFVTMPTALRY